MGEEKKVIGYRVRASDPRVCPKWFVTQIVTAEEARSYAYAAAANVPGGRVVRIVAKPRSKRREWWLAYPTNGKSGSAFETEEAASVFALDHPERNPHAIIHVREVRK